MDFVETYGFKDGHVDILFLSGREHIDEIHKISNSPSNENKHLSSVIIGKGVTLENSEIDAISSKFANGLQTLQISYINVDITDNQCISECFETLSIHRYIMRSLHPSYVYCCLHVTGLDDPSVENCYEIIGSDIDEFHGFWKEIKLVLMLLNRQI